MGSESQFTEETWNSWLEPFQAVRLLIEAGLDDREHAVNWLKGNLRRGALRAGGLHIKLLPNKLIKSEWVYGLYRSSTWNQVAAIPWKDDFWVSGNYEPDNPLDAVLRSSDGDEFKNYLTEIRFDPDPIADFCNRARGAVTQPPLVPALAVAARRGAKRKDWWDHLWIEMIRRIRAGTLRPNKPGELQVILEDYVRDQLGYDPGESTLKPMASNLFKYLEEMSGEIGGNSDA